MTLSLEAALTTGRETFKIISGLIHAKVGASILCSAVSNNCHLTRRLSRGATKRS
jgi:hypothetical protein